MKHIILTVVLALACTLGHTQSTNAEEAWNVVGRGGYLAVLVFIFFPSLSQV